MHLEVRFEAGEVAGEVPRLAIDRLDVRGGGNPAGLSGLGLSQPPGGLAILHADQGDLCQADQRCGRARVEPRRLKVTLLGLLDIIAPEQAVTHEHELACPRGVLGLGLLPGLVRRSIPVSRINQSGRRWWGDRAPVDCHRLAGAIMGTNPPGPMGSMGGTKVKIPLGTPMA